MSSDENLIDFSAERARRIHDLNDKRLEEMRKTFEQVLPLGKPKRRAKALEETLNVTHSYLSAFHTVSLLVPNAAIRASCVRRRDRPVSFLIPPFLDLDQSLRVPGIGILRSLTRVNFPGRPGLP